MINKIFSAIPKNGFLLFICGIFFIFTFSCTQERQPCLTPKIASLNIESIHYTTDTGTIPIDTGLNAAIFGALSSKGLENVIYLQQSANFTISLSPVADSCKWLFATDTIGSFTDTFTFYYQRQLKFLSNACGYTYFYSLDSLHTTHNIVDSFLITNTSVTNNVNTKHLKIYIHPDY